mgnify:CR=1 FL=1
MSQTTTTVTRRQFCTEACQVASCATLATLPEAVPEKLPMPSSFGKALEGIPKKKGDTELVPKKKDKEEKVETGFLERTDEALGRQYWLYVPDNYDPNVSHGVIVWFHPPGKANNSPPISGMPPKTTGMDSQNPNIQIARNQLPLSDRRMPKWCIAFNFSSDRKSTRLNSSHRT